MSGFASDDFPASPRRRLAGAARPSANPRIHAIQKPYSRPNSYAGPSSGQELVLNGNGNALTERNGSPTKNSAPTTRPTIPTSQSQRSFPRSGSESSLFGSLKGLISKPLSWLATPRSAKRDQSTWNAGLDSEDPESPSMKKIRRHSPPSRQRERGVYDPPEQSSKGKGKERDMLPPLPALSGGLKKLPTSRTAAAGLPHSQSMPYLDPPSNAFSPAKNRNGAITRSRGMNLAALANDDDEPVARGSAPAKEAWSPWKQQAGRSQTPVKRSSRSSISISEARDSTLPSLSPFRPPPSPSANGGLARSSTTNNLRRAGSIASDISMGRQSTSARQIKGSTSMLFGNGSVAGEHADEAMSVDGAAAERTRDGSVLDWFMRDRWSKEPGSPHHQRTSSLAPSSSMPPIRKGQLVWNSEKGFVRESELKAVEAPPVQQNQAERILFALESMRKTPLEDARKLTPSSSLPASLIGSSSRQIRRAINVPLATARAGESAKSRRDKDRLGGDERVSVMISPYGRRRAVDSELRERSVASDDYRQTKSPSASRSQATDHDMASTKTPTPEPPREPSPEPTPRRSSRLKRNETTEDQEETPRSKRPTRGKGTVKNAAVETSAPKESGRRRRKATTEPMSPEREAHPPVPSIPTITETAPSPSEKSSQSTYQPRSESDGPRQSSSLRARTEKTKRAHGSSAHGSRATSPTSGGRYSAREEDLPDMEELEQSKIALPSFSGINFGNFGVPAPSAPKAAASAPSTEPAEKSTLSLGTTGSSGLGVPRASGGPLSRLNASRPRASSPLAATSVVAEPDSPETKTPTPTAATGKADENGFYSLSGGKNTPTSSQPPTTSLFAPPKSNDGSSKPAFSFGLGKPSAPPAAATPSSDNGDVPNFFGRKSAPDSGTATPVVGAPAPFSFGSSAPKPAEPTKNDSSAPFSFGQTAPSAASASDKPAPAPLGSFNFGAKPAESDAKAAPAPLGSFNFGGSTSSSVPAAEKAAPAPLGSFNFGSSKPADTVEKPSNGSAAPSFFGSSKPADAPKSTEASEASKFSFGTTSAAPPAASSLSTPAFSFGAPAAAPAKPQAPTSGFSLGSKPAESTISTSTPKAPFSFGAPTAGVAAQPAKASEPAKAPGFSFGSTASTQAATPENKSSGFNFGQTSTTPASNPPASGGFTFGSKPAEPAKAPGSTGFGFGSSASAATKPNGTATAPTFGSAAPSASGSGFGFGQNGSSGGSSTSFGFGGGAGSGTQTAPAPAAANPFGGGKPAQTGSFGFGSSGASSTPAPAFESNNTAASPFGSAPAPAAPAANAAAGGGFNFAFGSNNASPGFGAAPAAPSAAPSFGFGQPSNNAPAATPSTPTTAPATSFGFGASTTPSQPSFTFGAPPAQNGSTTPAGQPAGFRFGSPAPTGTPPPDAGGFNLGIDSTAPGSPSGRKIKPLRRGTKR